MSTCTEAKLPPPPPSNSFGHKATGHGHILKMMLDNWAETTTHTSQRPSESDRLKILNRFKCTSNEVTDQFHHLNHKG
jgi:hypothetical protein